MNGLPVADDFIKEIDDCINETKTNHEERVSYMTYEMKMQEAHDDGRAEGRAEGERKNQEQTALDMLRDNMDIQLIMKYTHLSAERIAELAKTL